VRRLGVALGREADVQRQRNAGNVLDAQQQRRAIQRRAITDRRRKPRPAPAQVVAAGRFEQIRIARGKGIQVAILAHAQPGIVGRANAVVREHKHAWLRLFLPAFLWRHQVDRHGRHFATRSLRASAAACGDMRATTSNNNQQQQPIILVPLCDGFASNASLLVRSRTSATQPSWIRTQPVTLAKLRPSGEHERVLVPVRTTRRKHCALGDVSTNSTAPYISHRSGRIAVLCGAAFRLTVGCCR
jgi:hypothetical protein